MIRIASYILGTFLLLNACTNQRSGKVEIQNSEAAEKYVQGHTKGTITVHDYVHVIFQTDEEIEKVLDPSIVSMNPSTDVRVEWQGGNQLWIYPTTKWKADVEYKMEVHLDHLFANAPKNDPFSFTFQTIGPRLHVEQGVLRVGSGQDEMLYQGLISYAGYSDGEVPKPNIKAELDGIEVQVKLDTTETDFLYVVSPLKRLDKEQQLMVTYEDVAYTATVPPKNILTVMNMEASEEESGVLLIHFSNALKSNQDLTGLIEISDQDRVRSIIDENVIKVYVTGSNVTDVVVRVFPGIEGNHGGRTQSIRTEVVRMAPAVPEIELLEGNKTISPDPKNAFVSFKSINLKSVILQLEKVHQHNILQHLQINRLDQEYEIHRVAEPVATKRIDLQLMTSNSINRWNTFQLDLSPYFNEHPAAMYRVTFAFSPDDVKLSCEEVEGHAPRPEWMTEEEFLEKILKGRRNYTTYKWSERKNPCHTTFYQSQNWESKNIIVSPMAVIAKKNSANYLTCFVSHIETAEPLRDIEVSVFNYSQRKLMDGYTDSEGKAEFDLNDEEPHFVVAKKGEHKSYVAIENGRSLSMSPFDVSGESVTGSGKGFIYAERGVWRPGDTVHLNFIREGSPLDGMPVICLIKDPQGREVHRMIEHDHVGHIYSFPFVTTEDAPTGNWQALIRVGPVVFRKTLKIETVKPNRLAIDIDLEREIIDHESLQQDIRFDVEWLTGARAGNTKIEADLFLKQVPLSFPEFNEFAFQPPGDNWKDDRTQIVSASTDETGRLTANLDVSASKQSYGKVEALVTGKAFEPSGDFSIFHQKFPVYPYKHFVGIKKASDGRSLKSDKDHKFELVVVNKDGEVQSGKRVKITIRKMTWTWWWDRVRRRSSFNTGSGARVEEQTVITTGDKPVEWVLKANKLYRGRFEIQAEDLDSGHKTSSIFYVHVSDYWWMDSDMPAGASILDFDLTSEEVEVGDDIGISIPSEEGSKILLSVEADGKIVQSTWADTEKGQTQLTMKAVPEMLPNAYIHVALIHPYKLSQDGRPIRSYAVKSVKVIDKKTILEPIIDAPKEIKPQEKFEVKIKENEGKSMAYTLAVVDEGLLALTNFKTPDPHSAMMAKQALSISTWDNYGQIMGAEDGEGNRVLAIGGDMELSGKEDREAKRFEAVVKHLGPFYLKKSEQHTHQIELPSYLGKVRLMVVGAGAGAYGHAEKEMLVRQDLMVLGTAPRLLAPQDQFDLPVTVFAMDDAIQSAQVSVVVEGPVEVVGSSQQSLDMSGQSDVTRAFSIKAKAEVGIAKITIEANSGQNRSTYVVNLPVESKSPIVRTVVDRILKPNNKVTIDYQPIGLNHTNGLTVEVSNFPPMNLSQRLDYLIRYPYGCAEQTTSALFAQVSLESLTELSSADKKRIQGHLTVGMSKLQNLQSIEGGMTYWPGSQNPNLWLSTYVAHLAIVARKNGYAVPDALLDGLISFLTKRANSWTGPVSSDDHLSQSYRLYLLALHGTPAMGAMNRQRKTVHSNYLASMKLAGAYALSGHRQTAQKLIDDLNDFDYSKYQRYYGGEMRNMAVSVLALSAMGKEERCLTYVKKIAKYLGSKQYFNTHDIAWGLTSVSHFIKDNEIGNKVSVGLSSSIGNGQLEGGAPIHRWSPEVFDRRAAIELTNKTKHMAFVRMLSSGQPGRQNKFEAESKNLNLNVTYKDMNGQEIDIKKLRQGESFVVQMEVKLNKGLYRRMDNVAISHVFPSGWELLNTRIDGSVDFMRQSYYDFMDIRDDRIIFHTPLGDKKKIFYCVMNATYVGEYFYPPAIAEAMYNDEVYARKPSSIIEVISSK